MSETETGSLWDLYALDWVQHRAECARFCLGMAVSPAGQRPVSADIDYEFGTRNSYNFLQLTYFKVCNVSPRLRYANEEIQWGMGVSRPKQIKIFLMHHLQLGKMQKAASAAHTFFVANPSHLEMRNNIEKYRRMDEVSDDAFVDREKELETHWVSGQKWTP